MDEKLAVLCSEQGDRVAVSCVASLLGIHHRSGQAVAVSVAGFAKGAGFV